MTATPSPEIPMAKTSRMGRMRVMLPTLAYTIALSQFSCARPAPSGRPLLLWHTFNSDETETVNAILARAPARVQAVVVPFPRAFNTFREAVGSGVGCPDVFRAEEAWVPALAAEGLLDRRADGRLALPHSIDGLALLYNRDLVPVPPQTVDQLVEAASAAHREGRFGFFVRADAYWFLPFLYAYGGDLPDFDRHEVTIDEPPAVRALTMYRSLLRSAPAPATANDYEEQERRFGAGQIAMILNGPWAVSELLRRPAFAEKPDRLGIAPLWATPLSGHVYVVPRCATDKAAAWALAER